MGRSIKLTFMVWLLIIAGLGWIIYNDLLLRGENRRLTDENINLKQGVEEVAVFYIKSTPSNFYLKPVIAKIKRNGDKHVKALEALFAGPPPGSNLMAFFPRETKVLSFKLKKGLAVVNLDRSATKINVGSQGEALAVASIVNTLTKLPDVYKVKILIEGKEVDSLAGHVDLTGIFEYDNKVVVLD